MVRYLERGRSGLNPARAVENLHPTGALQVGSEQDGYVVHLDPQHNRQVIRRDIGNPEVGLPFPGEQSPDGTQKANELSVVRRQRPDLARSGGKQTTIGNGEVGSATSLRERPEHRM